MVARVLRVPGERLPLGGHRLHWIRCRVASPQEAGEAVYERPPEVASITAVPIGATLLAQHAEHVDNEVIGESDGTPGQVFEVLRPPMLAPSDDEWLEVRDPETGEWSRWGVRESFADCGPEDRCYVCDSATGTIELGPAVRQADGDWRHYGAVPSKGAMLREAYCLVRDGVVSVDDLDKIIRDGLGMRYAFIGPFETSESSCLLCQRPPKLSSQSRLSWAIRSSATVFQM